MKSVSIVGFGRFGQTLYRLLKDDFLITIYDLKEIKFTEFSNNTKIVKTVSEIYENETIFYCVPISNFEKVIKSHKKYFKKNQLLIDVLSVKLYPAKILKKYLKNTQTQALLTHPMFGPDSSKEGFFNLPLIFNKFLSDNKNYNFWKKYFENKGLRIIEITPIEHDKMAANSQGLTHFIGRMLDAYNFKKTPIDSLGTKKLLEIVEQTAHDTWQLFTDLQHYNPYTKKMRVRFGDIYDQIYNKLLPKQLNPKFLTFGIQGGKGSFNEEAILFYLKKANISKYKIKYLYTTEQVLRALLKGDIDRGQFAIQNSVGGLVDESIKAMANYKLKIIEEFAIKIAHALMINKNAKLSDITTVMTHPQVLAQCKKTLSEKYPNLKQVSGEKEMIDHAVIAKLMSENKLPKNIATMGSKVLAEIYDLRMIEDNLQDSSENYTSFLCVSRN